MSFVRDIFAQLRSAGDRRILQQVRDGQADSVSGQELLELVRRARAFLASRGMQKGDRCALLAHNSIRWVAMDLAIMAEGLVVVALYARQAPAELIAMMRDCSPALICCGDETLREEIAKNWPDGPPLSVFEEIFASKAEADLERLQIRDADAVTIIYTSGTSGEPKGVVLTAANIGFMLRCTSARLDLLMEGKSAQDRVFHYLPLCFAGSWIILLTSLLRGSLITLNTDLSKLANDMRLAAPDYFLNVPALLERVRKAVDEQLWKTGGLPLLLYRKAKGAWIRKQEGKLSAADSSWLWLANQLVFPTIRKKMIGENLRALICGSAPLNVDTQLFFAMLGIRVLQVYGLTETTAICTMDDPRHPEPGRVGPAVAGIEMKLGENDEIMVRGPNIFAGYWNRPAETAKVLRDGWFHTGDQGEVNAAGNWKIVGRIKNLIILGSGHNIAPEPIEDALLQKLPGAQQIVLAGNDRSYLSAIITGDVSPDRAQNAIDEINTGLPHYKQIRAFHVLREPFSIDSGLLTANGKLKREAIALRFRDEIEEMYAVKQAV